MYFFIHKPIGQMHCVCVSYRLSSKLHRYCTGSLVEMYFSIFSQKSRNLLQKIYLGLWHFTFNKTNHISIDLNLTFVSSLIRTSSEFFSSVFSVTATALSDPFVPFCSFHPLTSSWNPPDWCQKSAIEVSQAPEQCWDMQVFLRDRQLVFKTKLNDLGKTSHKKNRFLSGIAQISPPPPSPQFGQVVQLFLDVKNDV